MRYVTVRLQGPGRVWGANKRKKTVFRARVEKNERVKTVAAAAIARRFGLKRVGPVLGTRYHDPRPGVSIYEADFVYRDGAPMRFRFAAGF